MRSRAAPAQLPFIDRYCFAGVLLPAGISGVLERSTDIGSPLAEIAVILSAASAAPIGAVHRVTRLLGPRGERADRVELLLNGSNLGERSSSNSLSAIVIHTGKEARALPGASIRAKRSE